MTQTNGESCDDCFALDPQQRYTHYLDLGRVYGLAEAAAHVHDHMSARFPFDLERARRYAADIKQWLGDQMHTYGHVPDEHTGAFLPWWEGRRRMIDEMRRTYEALGKTNERQRQERTWQREVKGFTKLHIPDPKPLREPGEDEEHASD